MELERRTSNGTTIGSTSLISIRVERRAVAAAIFRGDHLEYADARQLSSARDKALASAVGFINWMLNRFPVESAALESIPNGHEFQRRVIHDAICADAAGPHVADLGDSQDCAARRVRSSAAQIPCSSFARLPPSIWPILGGTHAKVFIQDAAIFGLHVQTERLFIIN